MFTFVSWTHQKTPKEKSLSLIFYCFLIEFGKGTKKYCKKQPDIQQWMMQPD